jgi:hypothetical protein
MIQRKPSSTYTDKNKDEDQNKDKDKDKNVADRRPFSYWEYFECLELVGLLLITNNLL